MCHMICYSMCVRQTTLDLLAQFLEAWKLDMMGITGMS